jgi:hypothetical protein
MGKLVVNRHIFDAVIADHVYRNCGDDYEFYTQAMEQLEIRKVKQKGGEMETLYVDFGGNLRSVKEFSLMYGVPREQIALVRDLARDPRYEHGRRVRLKPTNQDYPWSLLNWNHDLHIRARVMIYNSENLYGSANV